MSRAIVDTPVSDEVRAAVATGMAAHERATRDTGPTDEWDRQAIDTVIHAFVRQGKPLLRELDPPTPAGGNPEVPDLATAHRRPNAMASSGTWA